MQIIMIMLIGILMVVCDGVIAITNQRAHNYRPKNDIERAQGWFRLCGSEWMFKNGNYLPEEIQRDSWYTLKSLEYCNNAWKTMKWNPGHYRYGVPVKSVWNNYWIKEAGVDYSIKYPFLRYPSEKYDKYGCIKGDRMSQYYEEREKKLKEKNITIETI